MWSSLLDNRGQNLLISENCANILDLPLVKTNHRLVGINGINEETCLLSTEFQLAPYFLDNFQSIKALVVGRVTIPLPNFQLQIQVWPRGLHGLGQQMSSDFSNRLGWHIRSDFSNGLGQQREK